MQRRAVELFLTFSLILIALSLAGCGGRGSSKVGPATTITITPSSASVDFGKFVTLVASAKDASGKTVDPATITWSSSNTAVATVTSTGANGSVCAGAWDSLTTPTVCTAPNPQVETNVTITAKSGNASTNVNVFLHRKAARVEVDAATGACVSQTQTLQMTARAFDSNNQQISAFPANFTWSSSDASIAAINNDGLVTAKRPGKATITASLTGTQGLPQTFITCPPTSISISSQNVTPTETSFSLSGTATKAVVATVVDTLGNPITDIGLTYFSSAPGIASVITNGLVGTVAALGAGYTGVTAACIPPTCNQGLGSVYSNVVKVTVAGAAVPKVLVGSASSSSVVVIDQNNTPSAPIAIPTITVNGTARNPKILSIVVPAEGSKAWVGTDAGLLQFDLGTNTFSSTQAFYGGPVLAASRDGSKILVTDGPTFSVLDFSTNRALSYTIPGVMAGDFSPDNLLAFAVTGNTLEIVNLTAGIKTTRSLANPGSDVKFLPQGSVAFAAEPGTNPEVIASCDQTTVGNPAAQAVKIDVSRDSAHVYGANGTTMFDVVPTLAPPAVPTVPTTCAPQFSSTVASQSLGMTVTPRQVLSAPNGTHGYLFSDAPGIFDFSGGVLRTIALTGSAIPTAGGVTPDSATLYIGTSAGDVQRIDVASGVVAQVINVGLKKADGTTAIPDFVAVRLR